MRLQDFAPPASGETLAWALAYASIGMAVFPTGTNKKPVIRGGHGFEDATADEPVIRAWWERYPYADPAWALPAGVVVVDLDAKSGRNGRRDFEVLEGKPPDAVETPIATTPSGGLHLFYDAGGRTLRQFAGAIPGHPGIDTRVGGKGFVVLPAPHNGRRWLKPLSTPLAPAPAWLPEEQSRDVVARAPAPAQQRAYAGTPLARYVVAQADKSVRNIAQRVERAVPGERNSVTFWAACRFAELARDGLIDKTWGVELLALAASRNGLPDVEARRAIESGFDHG
jgi:hypothetical protein